MKKYLGVLTLVLSVCFTSCDKDDDQNVFLVFLDVQMKQLLIMMLMQQKMMVHV